MSDKRDATTKRNNEGEGNKTAARRFNKAQESFVETAPVAEKAREAERALSGPEREELAEAEAIGRSHAAGEDPALSRSAGHDDEKIRHRAYEIWEGAGRPDGEADNHWRQAERDIKGS